MQDNTPINDHQNDNDKQLTDSIRDVAEALGLPLAQALVDHFGGTRLYVPARLKDHHAVIKKLGQDQAKELASEFGGMEIDVPMHLFNEAKARRKLVIKLHGTKHTIASIARAARCTERQVYDILGTEKKKNQTPLF